MVQRCSTGRNRDAFPQNILKNVKGRIIDIKNHEENYLMEITMIELLSFVYGVEVLNNPARRTTYHVSNKEFQGFRK